MTVQLHFHFHPSPPTASAVAPQLAVSATPSGAPAPKMAPGKGLEKWKQDKRAKKNEAKEPKTEEMPSSTHEVWEEYKKHNPDFAESVDALVAVAPDAAPVDQPSSTSSAAASTVPDKKRKLPSEDHDDAHAD